jgi:ATP-dependent DNA ligase
VSEQHLDLLPAMTRTLVGRRVCQTSGNIPRIFVEITRHFTLRRGWKASLEVPEFERASREFTFVPGLGLPGHGFDKVSAAALQKRLRPLIRRTQPYAKRIGHKGIWVEPKLLAEIEYRAKSAEGKVRHPFFRGLREDL